MMVVLSKSFNRNDDGTRNYAITVANEVGILTVAISDGTVPGDLEDVVSELLPSARKELVNFLEENA
jgi:hypothetical protein